MSSSVVISPRKINGKRLGVSIAVIVLAVGGLFSWLFWPFFKPAISVPAKVCEGNLPGRFVRAVLPKKGDPFQEGISYNFSGGKTSVSKGPGSGECNLNGGGEKINIQFMRTQNPNSIKSISRSNVEREAKKNGNTLIGSVRRMDTWGLVLPCFTKIAP